MIENVSFIFCVMENVSVMFMVRVFHSLMRMYMLTDFERLCVPVYRNRFCLCVRSACVLSCDFQSEKERSVTCKLAFPLQCVYASYITCLRHSHMTVHACMYRMCVFIHVCTNPTYLRAIHLCYASIYVPLIERQRKA